MSKERPEQYTEIIELPAAIAAHNDEMAKRLLNVAQQNATPVEREINMAKILSAVAPGSVNTPESYRLLAEIISFLCSTDKEMAEDKEGKR